MSNNLIEKSIVKSKKNLILGIFIFLSILEYSAFLFAQGGETAVPFLMISATPRMTGMGETGTGIADDASATFLNPGGLGFQSGQEMNLTYSDWLHGTFYRDLFYLNSNIKKSVENIGTFSASIMYFNIGKYNSAQQVVDESSNPFEYAITLGYAKRVFDELSIGLNLKYIYSKMRYYSWSGSSIVSFTDFKGTAFCGDIGILYKPQEIIIPFVDYSLKDIFSFGLNLANLGPNMSYDNFNQSNPLPSILKLGIGIRAFKTVIHSLTLAIDFNRVLVRRYTDQEPDEFYKAFFTAWGDGSGFRKIVTSTGLEYWFGDPDFLIFGISPKAALRLGFLYEDPNYGNRKYYTLGAGIRYSIIGIDLSYISTIDKNSPLDKTFKFGTNIIW